MPRLHLTCSKRARDPHIHTQLEDFAYCDTPITSPLTVRTHTHTQSPNLRQEAVYWQGDTEMWLAGLGASLASPPVLPFSQSLLMSTRTWGWHLEQRGAPALWSILPVSRCQAGFGFSRSRLCPKVPFLAKTTSSGTSLGTAYHVAVLSSEG